MTFTTIRRLAIILSSSALVLAGCGDDDTPSAEAVGEPAGQTDTGSAAPESDIDASDAPSSDVGAVLSIGDLKYTLPSRDSCVSTPQAMNAGFSDGPDIRLEVKLPPLDWETDTDSGWDPPDLGLADSTGEGRRSYRASPISAERYPDTEASMAVIAEYELGDGWATGSGFVIDTQGLVDAEAQGTEPPTALPLTFEIVCEP